MSEQEIDFKYKMHEDAIKFIQELDESNLSYFDKLDKLIEYSKKNMHLLGCHISSYNDNATKEDLAHDFYKIKGGIIEGKVVSAEEIITLAKLPSSLTLSVTMFPL